MITADIAAAAVLFSVFGFAPLMASMRAGLRTDGCCDDTRWRPAPLRRDGRRRPLFGGQGFGLVDTWFAAKRPAELHVFAKGGFGMNAPGASSEHWVDVFYW